MVEQEFRRVLGMMPTGVTILSAHGSDGPIGMTANSFTSVSLDPPLVLVCPAKSSATWMSIRATGKFCINVLAGHQEELSRRFSQRHADRFDGVPLVLRGAGPVIADATAWFEVELIAEHDGGDHTIAVCKVLALGALESQPALVFCRGQYSTAALPVDR